jgi:hypothetical protein
MKTDRGPLEIQFTANFQQTPEEFSPRWTKSRQNGLLGALTCITRHGPPFSEQRPPQLNPLALAHERLNCTIGCHSIHVHFAGSNHPIHVDQTRICTERGQLFRIHLLAADDAR